jgi:hypothetical protein
MYDGTTSVVMVYHDEEADIAETSLDAIQVAETVFRVQECGRNRSGSCARARIFGFPRHVPAASQTKRLVSWP